MADKPAVALHSAYEQIAAERQRRIEEHQANIAAIKERAGGELNILADGDSWFSYLLSRDVIQWIQADGNPSPEILNLAVAGDPVTATLGVTKRQRIVDNLRNPANGDFDALLFSVGGDDIAGDQFCFWHKADMPDAPTTVCFRGNSGESRGRALLEHHVGASFISASAARPFGP
jgi:hypothetical protein